MSVFDPYPFFSITYGKVTTSVRDFPLVPPEPGSRLGPSIYPGTQSSKSIPTPLPTTLSISLLYPVPHLCKASEFSQSMGLSPTVLKFRMSLLYRDTLRLTL